MIPETVGGATYVYWSSGLVAEVPPSVVTVMSTVPVPAGAVAVIAVSSLPVTGVQVVAAVDPKSTAVAPVNPLPLIVTVAPPVVGPLAGLTLVTTGVTPWVSGSSARMFA